MTKRKLTIAAVSMLAIIAALVLTACSYKWLTLREYAAMLKKSDSFTQGVTLAEYEASESKNEIDYGFDLPENAEVREKYGLDAIAGDGGELSKTLNLLAWVADKIMHDGSQNVSVPKENALNFLDYGYEKDYGINCRQLAITLAGCLSAVGIKARPVYIMPKAADSGDNHVITHVFIDSLGKWIAVDPSYGATFRNTDGAYLDCFELRTEIANGGEVVINEEFHYNHNKNYSRNAYITYLSKNLYWFTETINGKGNSWNCIPDGFDLKKWYLANNEFTRKQGWIDKETYRKNKEAYKNATFDSAAKELFLLV